MNENIDYDSKERPTTPLHPKANEEFKTVPSVSKLKDLELDLNPDLSDDDDDADGDQVYNNDNDKYNTEGSNTSNINSNASDIDKLKEVGELYHKQPKEQGQPQISPLAETQQGDTKKSNSNKKGKKIHPLSINESINTSEEVFDSNNNDDNEQLQLNRQFNYKDQLGKQVGNTKTEDRDKTISGDGNGKGNGNDEADVDIDDDDVDEEMFESDSSINDGDVEIDNSDNTNDHNDNNDGGFIKENNDDDNNDDFEDVINAGKFSENYTQASNKANEHKRKLFEIYNNDNSIGNNSNGETVPESDMEEHWSDFNGSPLISVDGGNDGTGRKSATEQDLRLASISNNRKKKLSSLQNSKLIAYIDGELLGIQRKFVQSFNAPPAEFDNKDVEGQRQENDVTKFGYQKLTSLLDDLNKIVDFIWYTVKITQGQPTFVINNPLITSTTTTTAIQADNNNSSNDNLNINSYTNSDNIDGATATNFDSATAAAPATVVTQPPTLRSFYQGQYLIRIAGDLVDYIQKYKIGKPELRQLILFIQKLDQLFVIIIDDLNGFDSTEKVRLASIAERTRIGVINITIRNRINDYKYEIGKLYEELFDRIS